MQKDGLLAAPQADILQMTSSWKGDSICQALERKEEGMPQIGQRGAQHACKLRPMAQQGALLVECKHNLRFLG